MCHRFQLLFLLFLPLYASAKVSLAAITIEGRQKHVEGIDVETPRFGWLITSDKNDVVQTSYRVIVASSEKNARNGIGDFWDSGNVRSDQSQWVRYGGKALLPDHTYYIKVLVRTNKGKAELTKHWATGMLGDSNWHGEWLGTDSIQPGDSIQRHSRATARYFRKEFTTQTSSHGKVVRAKAHVCGLGYFSFFLNGQRVGNDVMSPAQTDFTKTVAYCSYDVTPMLKDNNAIGVVVGSGYYFAPNQKYQTNVRVTYGLPCLRLMLSIEYENGKREIIATDKSWKMTSNGPIQHSNIYDGELYDANRIHEGWANVGFDDHAWRVPDMVQAPGGTMQGNVTPPMVVYEKNTPVSIKKHGTKYIVDFGSNGAGIAEILVDAAKGDTVRFRFSELLQEDSTSLYTANLRSAQATDYYISDGIARKWHPEFTWHGFRYMEVNGVRSLDSSSVKRLLIADDMETKGNSIRIIPSQVENHEESCVLNHVMSNAYRGIRSNYKSFPIDCPQRDERMPWTGDRTTGCLGESYLMDIHSLYTKWTADFRDSQKDNGALSDVTPAYWKLYNGNVTWPAALPFACDMLYRQYGDIKPFKDSWQTIVRWIAHVKEKSYKDGLITYDRYGDWCVPPEGPKIVVSKDSTRNTDGKLISSTYYYYLCKMLAKYSCLTGHEADSLQYEHEAELTKNKINKTFLHETGYANNTVTANLLPLAMGIVPDDKVAAVKDKLIATIHTNDDHISCGVIGIQWLLRWFSDNGYGWLAYKIASQTTYPGWGYMAEHGATTVWELWNGDTANPSMNSGNHVMLLGDLLPWCFERLGGIMPCADNYLGARHGQIPSTSGFKHVVLKPDFSITALNGMSVSHRSPYGTIRSQWQRNGNMISWEVCVPANCTAELHMPDTILHIGSGTRAFSFSTNRKSHTNGTANSPTMGWSSWNTYRVNISDKLIKKQADAMVSTGLSKQGYKYVNIDDGYFGGRDSVSGQLLIHPIRFPNGLKPVVDHIHDLGLKAGIYSDAGRNTCGSYYDKDSIAIGVGLYDHDHKDAKFFFQDMGFDFIKVDFCGGDGKQNIGGLVLDEQERYTAIANAIKNTGRDDVRLNVCRWDYPGTWVHDVASSWRTTHDISPRWSKVKDIIAQNLYLKAYANNGHYNDMDMLEVGRGMTEEEDKTHFGMWCFMNSPLLIGCDLTTIKPHTLALLKNEKLIALNQDPLHDQPSVAEKQNGCFVLARDLKEARGKNRAYAIYNPTNTAREISIDMRKLLLGGKVSLTNAFTGETIIMGSRKNTQSLVVPAHGTAIFTAHCSKRLRQVRYEAEAAYISDYQEIRNNQAVGSGIYEYDDDCSGGLKASFLGTLPTISTPSVSGAPNDLVFRDVFVDKTGEYVLTVKTVGDHGDKPMVEVNGEKCLGSKIRLRKGRNVIRLHNNKTRMQDVDYIELN